MTGARGKTEGQRGHSNTHDTAHTRDTEDTDRALPRADTQESSSQQTHGTELERTHRPQQMCSCIKGHILTAEPCIRTCVNCKYITGFLVKALLRELLNAQRGELLGLETTSMFNNICTIQA